MVLLIANGIQGKYLIILSIKNMYMETKSIIKMNGMTTDFFTCNMGVRQGEIYHHFCWHYT